MNNNEESNSESTPETGELHIQFAKLLNKVLTCLSEDLFEQVNEGLLQKCRLSNQDDHIIITNAIEDIVRLIVTKYEAINATIEMDINKHDYRALEKELQKREAEVRGHYRIMEESKIFSNDLEDRIEVLQNKLEENMNKLKATQKELDKMQQDRQSMLKKLDKYQEKIYELNREGAWKSAEKKQSEKLLHKASLNLKNRAKMDSRIDNISKSRQLISRKQGSKVPKQKGSRVLCFDSVKMRYEANQGLPTKKTASYYGSKVTNSKVCTSAGTPEHHNVSVNIGETEKRRKLRFAKQITEVDDRRDRNSLHL